MISRSASRRIRREKISATEWRRRQLANRLKARIRRIEVVQETTGVRQVRDENGKFVGVKKLRARLASLLGMIAGG